MQYNAVQFGGQTAILHTFLTYRWQNIFSDLPSTFNNISKQWVTMFVVYLRFNIKYKYGAMKRQH